MFNKSVAVVLAVFAASLSPCAAVRAKVHVGSALDAVSDGPNPTQVLRAVAATRAFTKVGSNDTAQVNLLCNVGSADTAFGWSLIGSDDSCACECKFDECSTLHCPEGYNHENEMCVRVEAEEGKVIPAIKENVECPEGELKIDSSRVFCSVDRGCPPPPASNSATQLLSAQGCEKCEYDVTCKVGQTLEFENGVPMCVTPPVVTEDTTKRFEVEAIQDCPIGSERSGGVCRKALAECPVQISLPLEALACGPNTDLYLDRMMGLLARHAKKLRAQGISDSNLLSCSATCASVFTKMSECAEQDDGPTCVGRAARAGAAIEPIGKYCVRDTSTEAPVWLKRTKRGKELPCKDMYGSEFNFAKAGWLGLVEKIEAVAVKHYITLVGTYAKSPVGTLDCRKSSCGKANSYAERSARNHEFRAIEFCLAECKKQYG